MSRKEFIESHGGTCRNWTWSWSFVSSEKKFIIFGAWDVHTDGQTALILDEKWQFNGKGRRLPAYGQSREHVRLVEEEGYSLFTFPIRFSDESKDDQGFGPAKIDGFEPKLYPKVLKRVGSCWYASDDRIGNAFPEEVAAPEYYVEGASKRVSVNSYERNSEARYKCIEHHGYQCAVCSFDFFEAYGDIGKHYIHVHHIVPLAEIRSEYQLDPIKDLVPICPNCHSIIHRTKPPLTIEQLKAHLGERGKCT